MTLISRCNEPVSIKQDAAHSGNDLLESDVSAVVAVLGMSIGIEPTQKRADAAVRQSNTRIGSAVIEIDGVPVCCDGVAAGEYDILHVSVTFVVCFRRKHPRISPDQAFFRLLKGE